MKHPSTLTYLIGNGVSFATLCLGLVAALWYFFTTGDGGLFVVLFLVGASAAYRANARIRHYRDWQREWDAIAPPPARPMRRR